PSDALAPHRTPAAAAPSMPMKTRRPMGFPSVGSGPAALCITSCSTAPQSRTGGGPLLNLELGAEDAGPALGLDLLGQRLERQRRLAARVDRDDRVALVSALAEERHQRHLPDQRHAQSLGQVLAA